MNKKLSDDELKELFIKIVRPYEEDIRTKKKKVIAYRNSRRKYIDNLVDLKPVGEKEVQAGILKTSTNNSVIFYKTTAESTLFSFIRHLRNSIAHCHIKIDPSSNSYLLEDLNTITIDKQKIEQYTMSGKIEITRFNQLIEYIHDENEKLNSMKNKKVQLK